MLNWVLVAVIASVGAFGGHVLGRRYMPADRNRAGIVCGVLAILGAAAILLIDPQESPRFRVAIGIIVAMAVGILYRVSKLRSA